MIVRNAVLFMLKRKITGLCVDVNISVQSMPSSFPGERAFSEREARKFPLLILMKTFDLPHVSARWKLRACGTEKRSEKSQGPRNLCGTFLAHKKTLNGLLKLTSGVSPYSHRFDLLHVSDATPRTFIELCALFQLQSEKCHYLDFL